MSLSEEDYASMPALLCVTSGGVERRVLAGGDLNGSMLVAESRVAQKHKGLEYLHSEIYAALAVGSAQDHLIRVNSGFNVHFTQPYVGIVNAPFWVQFYEAPQVSSLGAAASVRCTNRNYPDSHSAFSTYEAPVVSSVGNPLFGRVIAGNQQAGGMGTFEEEELVLTGGRDYLLRCTNKSIQVSDCAVSFSIYIP